MKYGEQGYTELKAAGGNGLAEVLDAGKMIGSLTSPEIVTHDGMTFVVDRRRDGSVELNLREDLMDAPVRINTRRRFYSTASFVEYVNEFKTGVTRCYGTVSEKDSLITAIIDDHDAGGVAGHCVHIAVLDLSPSPEWKAWTEMDEKNMPQRVFAE
ncbi:MAG: DUF2303 family protein, partial [Planctomycetes bacterium]|nr:DUF2303 family protein [Planctomycetota bacterium]